MRKEELHDIRLVLWFIKRRLVELALLAVTTGSFYIHRLYIGPLMPFDAQPLPASNILFHYVVPYAEAVFAFVIAIEIAIVIWINRLPPRLDKNTAWWI